MTDKPRDASAYAKADVELVRATCLYLATKLGDLMDELVIVGGLVPSLLIDQVALPDGVSPHAGTRDLDLGLALAILDEGHYRTLTERLRAAGFTRDRNDEGNLTSQRWRIDAPATVTVDFLIPPGSATDRGGQLRNLENDFAAVITPGLLLAFRDRLPLTLEGSTILAEHAARTVQVCGPGAFVVLKALAFRGRGENKDAYDLYYVLRNFGAGVAAVAGHLKPLLDDADTLSALQILKQDFAAPDFVGPRRLADFLVRRPDDRLQTEVVALVARLLQTLGI